MAATPPPVSGNTANLTVILAANGVAVHDLAIANLNVLNANTQPLTNTVTLVMTGLAAKLTANTLRTACSALTAENNLAITINETGTYAVEGLFLFMATNANNNGASGFQMDLQGGSATQNAMVWGYVGTANGQMMIGTDTVYSFSTGNTNFGNAGANSQTNWIRVHGYTVINAAGTVIPRWAQVTSSQNSCSLAYGTHWMLTKIG